MFHNFLHALGFLIAIAVVEENARGWLSLVKMRTTEPLAGTDQGYHVVYYPSPSVRVEF